MKSKSDKAITLEESHNLRNICNKFGKEAEQEKKNLLITFSQKSIEQVKVLLFYHDCLLFMLAHPESDELRNITASELHRCITIAQGISVGNNGVKKVQIGGTGIHHSYITARFSFDLVKWLSQQFPQHISFYSCDAEAGVQKEIIKLLSPGIQREALDKNFSTMEKWLNYYSAQEEQKLSYLLSFLEAHCANDELRDHFFDSLQVFVQVNVEGDLPSRSIANIGYDDLFYHREELLRKSDTTAILSEKIKAPLKLTLSQKLHLNTVARCSLLMLLRETDPVTYANINATELHDMGRGLKIALYYASPNRRMPVESYVGYMAFKNGLPLAYGGGWILGHFSRIGVNVYEPFRGGESAWVFLQILRLYTQRFNVSTFEAEPYQIGKNNPEGIKSGAFWFYYRLGFRPSQVPLLQLSEDENLKIKNQKGYRTDEKTLKKLADSFMVLKLSENEQEYISTMEISEAVSRKSGVLFAGQPQAFTRYAQKYVMEALEIKSKDVNTATSTFRDLAAMLCLIPDLGKWSKADKKKTIPLLKLRDADSEYGYIVAMQKHKKLFRALLSAIR